MGIESHVTVKAERAPLTLTARCCGRCLDRVRRRMAQWEKLLQLTNGYAQQLDELYDRDALPMEVRHYLAAWIETQEW